MITTLSIEWKSEAGPRQTKQVENALHKLRQAGHGTLHLSTYEDGTEHQTIQWMYGSSTPEETAHRETVQTAEQTIFDTFSGLITRTNFQTVISAIQTAIPALEAVRPVLDERRNPEQIAEDRRERIAKTQVQNEAHKAKQETREAAAVDLIKDYPYLNRVDRYAGGVAVAKNIRIVLKREFPSIKFSVKSDYNSVNINWTDGPTAKQVEEKTSLFKGGHFNGMEDIYEDKTDAFNDAFGSVKYIFTRRDYANSLYGTLRGDILKASPGQTGYDYDRLTHQALSGCDMTGKGSYEGISFDYEEQRYILSFEDIQTPKAPTSGQTEQTAKAPTLGACTIEEHTHTKKGFQMWIVILSGRTDRDTFNELRNQAKDLDGWYSRAWGQTPGGFAFKDKANAYKFAGTLGGTPDEPKPDGTTRQTTTNPVKSSPDKAQRLRSMADKLTDQVEAKRSPMTQNATPKRTLEYKSRLIEGDRLDRVQTALYAIADALEAGTWPDKVPSKADLMRYLTHRTDGSGGYYEIIDTGEYSCTEPGAALVQALALPTGQFKIDQEKRAKAYEIESKILAFVGCKIPGFFVTHKEGAERVIYEADIQKGETVLEPSAGTGNLADLAREAGGDVYCIEIRPALAEILELKGHDVKCCDFLDRRTGSIHDKIIMNPPFEKGQDIDHVRLAYSLLKKDGGRLVAIMSEGTFFRSDSKASGFRTWLEDVGGWSDNLPEGSFAKAGEVNRTGTATRIVVIEK